MSDNWVMFGTKVSKTSGPIVFYLQNLYGGGAEKTVVTVANGLASQGLEVTILLWEKAGPYISEVSDEVQLSELRSKRAGATLGRFLDSLPFSVFLRLKNLLLLLNFMLEKKPSMVISGLNDANILTSLATALTLRRYPLTLVQHSKLSESIKKPGIHGKAWRLTLPACFRFAHYVIAVSRGVAEDLASSTKRDIHKIQVIENPINFEKIHSMSKEEIEEIELLEFEGQTLIFVGRLVMEKRVSDILIAFKEYRRSVNCRLLILGKGSEELALREQVAKSGLTDDVVFLGFKKNPYKYIALADLLVLSSEYEGFGNVLVEAMAIGVTPVSSDCDYGPREILDSGRFGFLYPTGNTLELGEALRLASGPQRKEQRELVERALDFNLPSILQKWKSQLEV